jgi:site-specific DNA-methyltransferase (adenine-specific)
VVGDARSDAAYDAALQGRRADLLLTDPPYCLLTRRRKGGDLRDPKGRKVEREPALRFESVREYRAFTREWMERALPRLHGARPLVIWTNFLGHAPIVEAARALGYGERWGELEWGKRSREGGGNERLVRVYEVALVLGRSPPPAPGPADPPGCWAAITGYDGEGEGTRWGAHPHHKPFSALEPLVRAYSRPGELVLDPFAGSGSIPVAAARLGREVACLELRPEWAALVTRRLADMVGERGGTPIA